MSSKYLCTFPGKYGDILWSLPTARFIAEKIVGEPVDFAVMPYYKSLCELIEQQAYIEHCFVIKDWLREHDRFGDQPWHPPSHVERNYERIWNLGYRQHPGKVGGTIELPLIDFIAWQQGIRLPFPSVPFLVAKEWPERMVAVAFNSQYATMKTAFLTEFREQIGDEVPCQWDISTLPWSEAARVVSSAIAYVGDRSSNWVVAHGFGKTCITYEPHPARHKSGGLGGVFGCPHGTEIALPFGLPPKACAQAAASIVKKKMKEQEEKTCETVSR